MKQIAYLLILAVAVSLTGCATKVPRTPAQQAAHDKEIAKIEKRALNLGGFFANLAGNILVNTATNYVNQKFGADATRDPDLRGFRK